MNPGTGLFFICVTWHGLGAWTRPRRNSLRRISKFELCDPGFGPPTPSVRPTRAPMSELHASSDLYPQGIAVPRPGHRSRCRLQRPHRSKLWLFRPAASAPRRSTTDDLDDLSGRRAIRSCPGAPARKGKPVYPYPLLFVNAATRPTKWPTSVRNAAPTTNEYAGRACQHRRGRRDGPSTSTVIPAMSCTPRSTRLGPSVVAVGGSVSAFSASLARSPRRATTFVRVAFRRRAGTDVLHSPGSRTRTARPATTRRT